MQELIIKIQASSKRSIRNLSIAAFFILLLIAVIIWSIVSDQTATPVVKVLNGIFAIGLIYLEILFFRKVFSKQNLAEELRNSPNKFIEIKAVSILSPRNRPSYQKNLYFKTADGKSFFLSDHKTKIDELIPLLKKELKNAKFIS